MGDSDEFFIADEILQIIPPLLINVAKDPEVFPELASILEYLLEKYDIDSPDTIGNLYEFSKFFLIFEKIIQNYKKMIDMFFSCL